MGDRRSEYARTRPRDELGRFVNDVDEYFNEPFKVVWEPLKHGPKSVFVRQYRLYWWQKILYISMTALVIWGLWQIFWA